MAAGVLDFADAVDAARPAEAAFAAISDLDAAFAALARRYPIEVRRLRGEGPSSVGDRWRIKGRTRIGERAGKVEVVGLAASTRIALRSTARGFELETVLKIEATGDATCRISASNRLIAKSLKARILAPAIRLARGRIERGHAKTLCRLAAALEAKSLD